MIKTNYEYSSLKLNDLKEYEKRLTEISNDFRCNKCLGNDFTGWYNYVSEIDLGLIEDIKITAINIRKKYDVFVLCGIGGSYLGARAVIEAIKGFYNKDIEIIYIGNTFDEKYIKDTIDYLKDKNFCVNVVSKSGTTLETAIAFRLLKDILIEKFGKEYKERIFATTDSEKGCLRRMADKEGYKTYVIPDNIGGRYSVFTPVGLLPAAVAGVEICDFLKGAKEAFLDVQNINIEQNVAYQYAAYRYLKYSQGYPVELFATYSPYLNMLSEWWKQLFGESEGKNKKGLFPASVNFSTDLHSLGQFIQQGSKMLFMTQLKIIGSGLLKINNNKNDDDNLNYLTSVSINDINLSAQKGTNVAHYSIGEVDNFTFEIADIKEKSVGYLLFILMYSCMLSASLLGVNPFNQPGVEFYKNEMKKNLKK